MIRVLHVLGGLDRGGAETMVMNLYRAIDRTQIQFDFIIHTEEHQAYYDEILSLGGRIYSFPPFKGTNIFALRKIWKDFFRKHPEYKILHSHVRSYASLYLPIARNAGLKTIVHSHNTSSGKGLKAVVKYCLQRGLRKNVDYYFACSDVAGSWLFGETITKQSNYFLLKNAIDVGKYTFSESFRKKIRNEFGIKDEFVLGHVGRFHPQKNHTFLIDVFAEVHKKNPNTLLMLVGTGGLIDSIKEKVDELGLNRSVIFAGSRSDVNEILSAFDVFVFPSLFEGLPVTVIEAQAAGVTCFVSNTITKEVGISELVHYLPIDQGTFPWVESLKRNVFEKENVSKQIKDSGYDVCLSANFLMKFYLNV